ncbi:hypothetical protein BU23DRAFT_557806 [Bimuria novae-zelandiae CBS 107.79]|uniref:Uncharacterized protein n=1 Tax=Bimuria novae-zelandiae CBS 107.79 TaxID=1447943 RepID=A0A6A5UXB2_9PLEO|nr:hypothetical protein BU23DRAFT_557806 [Bimuria novae-zelandiae CBS 107.79]
MPVTTCVSPVEMRSATEPSTYTPEGLLAHVCPVIWADAGNSVRSVIDSSFQHGTSIRATRHFSLYEASTNGFLGIILDAYRMHNHVVLRPEDV